MPIKRPILENQEIYHIISRAVDGTNLFLDEKDYVRMVHNLYAFNDSNPISFQFRQNHNNYENSSRSLERDLFVEILAFCLMPNHIHLLLRQLQDNGISNFMRKVGAGYGGYRNSKYKRSGHLFQGRFRAVHVEDDRQLMTAFVYIHTNPVAIMMPGWKENGIKKIEEVKKFLEETYKWSSYIDYLEIKNFPSLTSREFLTEMMGGVANCKKFVNDWLLTKKELYDFDKMAIE